jgi:NAD(P)-dependent dehydrogenase (short-subunit alcohol dehydrogenase family)
MRVLVTGGSRGIGKAIVNKFEKHGYVVYSPTREDINLSNKVSLKFKEFDIIINNAGINPIKPVTEISNEEVMRVNYLSPLEIVQQCLPFMINQNYGRIINIGSIWIDSAKPGRLAYSASKNALHSLTKALTAEYAQYGILSNTISPGFILTDLTTQNNTKAELDKLTENIPTKRLGLPNEIAKLVYFLSIENTYISGQNIKVDGGYSCTTY